MKKEDKNPRNNRYLLIAPKRYANFARNIYGYAYCTVNMNKFQFLTVLSTKLKSSGFSFLSLLLSHSFSLSRFRFPGPLTLFLIPLVSYNFCRSIEFTGDDDDTKIKDKHDKPFIFI